MPLRSRYTPFTLTRPLPGTRTVDEPTTRVVAYGRGLIQPVSGSQGQFLGPVINETVTHRLYTDVNLPAQGGDKVTQNGVSWTVVFATQPDGISSVGDHKEILLGKAN